MNNLSIPNRALIIATPYIDRILSGEKTWEMRSRACKFRETIGLIRKGSGHIIGLVNIVGNQGPFTLQEMLVHQDKHRISNERLNDPAVAKWNIAWVLQNAWLLPVPVAYKHPNGAQSWIKLEDITRQAIAAQL